jgi:anti-sigma-K factor RskA
MSPERLDDLLALAALGELTDAEERELDAALATDADAAEELRADLAIAAELQGIHAETPPLGLRDRVLESITTAAQDPMLSDPMLNERPNQPVTSLDARRATAQRRRSWMPKAVAAAAVLVLAGGAFVAVTSNDGPSSPIEAVVDADDAVTSAFAGEFAGELSVVASASENAIVLDGAGLDVLPGDRTYQLWSIDDETVTSIGVFRSESSGDVQQRFTDVDISGLTLAVTIEPASGSATPTLPIIATT